MRIGTNGLNHLALLVADPERSARFHAALLDTEVAPRVHPRRHLCAVSPARRGGCGVALSRLGQRAALDVSEALMLAAGTILHAVPGEPVTPDGGGGPE